MRTRANGNKNPPVLGTKTLAPRPLLQYFFPGYRCVMSLELSTDRLLIREWELSDAEDALKIYGADEVARWLTPEWRPVNDTDAMRSVLHAWIEAGPNLIPPAGRWAIVRQEDEELVGAVTQAPATFEEDFELTWALRPDVWVGGMPPRRARPSWPGPSDKASTRFAVARPTNERAVSVARRLGMEWVGETEKYYNMPLQVFRLRPG